MFEESGGLVGLETLEYANNEPLRQQADGILDTYFYKDEDNGTVQQLPYHFMFIISVTALLTHCLLFLLGAIDII